MKKIAIVDYGMGNLRSVWKAIEHVAPSVRVDVTSDPDAIRRANSVVFPGQGAIGGCFAALEARRLREVLVDALQTKPFLGICLGLQALYEFSDEGGGVPGLNVLPGRVRLFPRQPTCSAAGGRPLKVPHMGWNEVDQIAEHPLWEGIKQGTRFYFVHSYYVESRDNRDVVGLTEYGIRFTSAAARANVFAIQCHPEKSQQAGLRLLKNFVNWDGS